MVSFGVPILWINTVYIFIFHSFQSFLTDTVTMQGRSNLDSVEIAYARQVRPNRKIYLFMITLPYLILLVKPSKFR